MLNERLGHRNDTSGPKESCEVVLEYCLVKRSDMATLSKYIIISLAGIQLLKEIFQITQVSRKKICCFEVNCTFIIIGLLWIESIVRSQTSL